MNVQDIKPSFLLNTIVFKGVKPELLEALLNYVEQETDGFLILVRDSKPGDERS